MPREVGPDAEHAELRPPVAIDADAPELARIAARALAAAAPREVDTSHLQPVRLTVREAAGMVVDELARAGGTATFAELTAGCRHRVEVIVHFLALLELATRDHVELSQPERFGTLTVALLGDGVVRLDVDEFTGAAGDGHPGAVADAGHRAADVPGSNGEAPAAARAAEGEA